MSILISIAGEKEAARVGAYLAASRYATPYHHMQWLQATKIAYGFDYEYFIAEINAHIVGVFPVCVFKNIAAKSSFCSLPFCDVGGVVADNDEIKEKLIQFALNKTTQQQMMPLELRQRRTEEASIAEMANQKVSMLLDLPESADMLLAGFKPKLRSQIKKAGKNGLLFDSSNDAKSIEDFFYVFCRNMHLLGSPTHSIKWFQALRESYQDDLLVGRVWLDGKIVGAGIILFSGKNVAIPWASTLRDYNRLAPNMLLYWNMLRVSCDRGCKQFDFGRSTFGEGTYKFKQQWGAKPMLLDWQYIDKHGKADREGINKSHARKSQARSMIETLWKKLPLSVVNTVGPHLRRHISL